MEGDKGGKDGEEEERSWGFKSEHKDGERGNGVIKRKKEKKKEWKERMNSRMDRQRGKRWR